MRGLMQQGRAGRAASPGCIVATSPTKMKGQREREPKPPSICRAVFRTCLQLSSSFRCYRTDFAFGNPA